IQLPIGAEDEFRGIIDLVEMKAVIYKDDLGKEMEEIEITEEFQEQAEEAREQLLEALADIDENIMEKYLGGEEISVEEMKAAIRKGTLSVELYPCLCGSAFKNKGVQKLLDAVVDYLPSPVDIPSIKGVNPETEEEVERHA